MGWLGDRTTFGLTITEDNARWTGEQTATTTPGQDLTVTCGDFDFTFAVVFNQFKYDRHGRANELRMSTKEWCELTITSKTPLPYNGFERQVKAIMDLLTLVAHAPAGVLDQRLRYMTTNEQKLELGIEHDTAELFARHIHQPIPGNDETKRVEYLFTLDDVGIADILPKWMKLHEQTWLACAMLFGLRYVREGYTQSRLMTSVTAAEAMHRELHPNETALPPDQFNDVLERTLGALAGRDAEAKAARKYLRDNLKNRLSCKERLLQLADIPDRDAVAKLITDVPRWAKDVRDARDGVAHASRERLTPDSAANALHALEINIMLISLVLMAKIGVPAEVQRRAVGSQYLWYIVQEFNRN